MAELLTIQSYLEMKAYIDNLRTFIYEGINDDSLSDIELKGLWLERKRALKELEKGDKVSYTITKKFSLING